jgi:hypothetical protein
MQVSIAYTSLKDRETFGSNGELTVTAFPFAGRAVDVARDNSSIVASETAKKETMVLNLWKVEFSNGKVDAEVGNE